MTPELVPPYVAEAQRRYLEMLDNMEALDKSVKRLLAMPEDDFKAWFESKSDGEKWAMFVTLYMLTAVPPPSYEALIIDELNRRHGLCAGMESDDSN